MNIGGIDFSIYTNKKDALALAIEAIHLIWLKSVSDINLSEAFVYKDENVRDSLNKKGWTSEYNKEYIYIVYEPNYINITIGDDKDPELLSILNKIKELIS
jgi:hypothetical protein